MMKKGRNSFLCALCGKLRTMRYKSKLSPFNYLQVSIVAGTIAYFCFPIFGYKALFLVPVLWFSFESTNKLLYRKELPCPHCGFDPVWYKRDVKVARRKVEAFWAHQPNNSNMIDEAVNIAETTQQQQ